MTVSAGGGEIAGGVARAEGAFAVALACAFFAVGLFVAYHHEPWRDELQVWLVARDTPAIAGLFDNRRYDGHPALWFLIVYPLTRLTRQPAAMQLVHLLIATASAYLFARFAPFTRTQRALFCFGYYPAYEYSALSRSYALGFLLLFAACAAFNAGSGKRLRLIALLLALLANASGYGLMIACAVAAAVAYDFWRGRRAAAAGVGEDAGSRTPAELLRATSAALIFAAGAALAVWTMTPGAGSGHDPGWYLWLGPRHPPRTLSIVWNAFAPLPPPSHNLWNANALAPGVVAAALSVVILIATALVLARRRAALVAYALGAGAILLFTHAKHYGGQRHHGHLYVLFVACLWLAARLPDDVVRPRPVERLARLVSARRGKILNALFALHALVAAVYIYWDWRHPFSRSRDAADFLRARGLERHYVVADRDTTTSGLTAYLGRGFRYARGDREGTYIVWDRVRNGWPVGPGQRADLAGTARRAARERRGDVVVVSSYRLPPEPDFEPLGELTGSIVVDENYYLYLVRSAETSAPSP